MEPIGVLISGYGPEDARTIKAFLDRTLDTYVLLVGVSSTADRRIEEILRQGPTGDFQDEETKILMFLGFSEVQRHMVLEGFPGEGGLGRPIFCSLTGQNRQWPIGALIAHLVEEHRRWSGKGG